MKIEFEELTTDDIECKISTINEKGASLLLYKTARVDMDKLDKAVGNTNWKCDYKEIKGTLYCGISIWDEEKKEWITKWDCGIPSEFGDKEKGEASDSFKRAGFKWGIGSCLYTAPFIWISSEKYKTEVKNGKNILKDKFHVSAIKIENKRIIGLQIENQNNQEVYLLKPPTSKS